jgi:hypothetical protein
MSGSVVRIASVALAALGLAGFSLPSQAVTITSGASSYSFNWSYSSTAGLLTGSGTLAVSGFNSNVLKVNVTLNNSSAASSRLTAFGFGIDPNANGTILLDNLLDGGLWAATMSSMPGLAGIEVCAWGGLGCGGGQYGGGIYGGNSDSFALLLAGNWGNSVNIDPIGFKYGTDAGSFQFNAADAGSFKTSGGSVPAPGPLALFGFGLAALLVRRRPQAS